ncbi:MAG TPA: LamG-like jellyroll fold domain-containing protein [Verrucomicrobiae bacterium]|nr:LamG-like jellyroll fold domain-containing protein [Verrucomicrobiae bacterium]
MRFQCHGCKTAIRSLLAALLICFSISLAPAAVSGTKSALIMLVSLNDAPIDCTVAEVNGMVFTNSPLNVDSFYNAATWGSIRWTGSVINVSINDSITPCDTDNWANQADTAARALGYEPNNYTTRVYTFRSSQTTCGYAFAYGNRVINFHGTDLFAYAHEMGHTIGFHHSVTDHNNDGVFEDAYGGKDDCMGGESYTFNAPHAIWGGWLPHRPEGSGGWRQITSDGTYQISPLEIDPTNALPNSQALKIVPPVGNPYFLSFRQPLGFNRGWTASQVGKDGRTGTGNDPVPPISANYPPYYYKYAYGVGVHRHSGGTGAETYEIAVLENHQQLTLPGTGIVIRQTARDTNKVTLSITGFNGSTAPNGVTLFEHVNYGGAQSQVLTPGNYNLSQLGGKGVPNDWASSCRIPPGITLVLYQHDNFGGTAWTNTSSVTNLALLNPGGADNQLSSCRVFFTSGQAPPVPADLSAIVSHSQVRLSWSPTPSATNYVIKRGPAVGGPFAVIATAPISSFTDTGLTNGIAAYYTIAAANAFGSSPDSSPLVAVPTSDLIARWKFDENGGSLAADASGNNNNGILVNGPTWFAPGKFGTAALTFNSANLRSVTIPHSSSLNNPTKAITLSAWVYAFDWNGNRRILQKGNADNQYRLLAENSVLKFHLNGVDQLTAPLPPINAWVHIAATWDGLTMLLYTNGIVMATREAGGTISTTADVLAIARKNTSGVAGDYFNGRLDDVRIYNRALAPGEIASMMTNSAPQFASDVIALDAVTAGEAFHGTLALQAQDADNDTLSFSKLNGPAWLSVSANGNLSGTPLSSDAGTNTFNVRVTDGHLMDTALMHIHVLSAANITATIVTESSDLQLRWTGGIPPYQLQMRTNLEAGDWTTIGEAIFGNELTVTPTNAAAWYRILGN